MRATVVVLLALLTSPGWAAPQVSIVAAENFYGDVARQLAGPDVAVTSILSNPDEDPHLFEASPSVARALSSANIVIANGADYDPWMTKLLRAGRAPARRVIVVSELIHARRGANPHLWYDPVNMAVAASAIATALSATDPPHAADYAQRLKAFTDSLMVINAKIASIRTQRAGDAVTATETVFGPMAAALGLTMRNERFQLSVMNNTEPRASDVAAFEADLREHRVRVLIYNRQASDTAAQRLLGIARASSVPVVGVTETAPPGLSYQAWMEGQLDALEAILSRPAP